MIGALYFIGNTFFDEKRIICYNKENHTKTHNYGTHFHNGSMRLGTYAHRIYVLLLLGRKGEVKNRRHLCPFMAKVQLLVMIPRRAWAGLFFDRLFLFS